MAEATALPQSSSAPAPDTTAAARLPFVTPRVSELGKLTGLTQQIGTSSL